MKKSVMILLTLAALSGAGEISASNESYVPYYPSKAELSEILPSSDYSMFTPSSVYSLQVEAQAGAYIKICDEKFQGFVFEPEESGIYRFVVTGTNVDVFKEGHYVGSITVAELEDAGQIVFPDIYGYLIGNNDGVDATDPTEENPEGTAWKAETFSWSVVDDASAKTGIYSEENLFKNPGFETAAMPESEDDVVVSDDGIIYIPADWFSGNFGPSAGATAVLTDYTGSWWGEKVALINNKKEGNGVLQHHGWNNETSGKYFGQNLENLVKPNTTYQIAFSVWNHSDTNSGSYTAKLGTEPNDDSILSYTWTQPSGAYTQHDEKIAFTTHDFEVTGDVYFTIIRENNVIAHFDRMTMVEATSAPNVKGISGSGFTNVNYEPNEAFAPVIELRDGEVLEMTRMIVNPDNLQGSTGWFGNNNVTWGQHYSMLEYEAGTPEYDAASSKRFLNMWSWEPFSFNCYQDIEDLPNGIYTIQCVARSSSTDEGFLLYATGLKEFTIPIIVNDNEAEEGAERISELGYGWNTHRFDAIVNEGKLRIGAKGTTTEYGRWYSVSEFRLYYKGEADNQEVVEAMRDKISSLMELVEAINLDNLPIFAEDNLNDAYLLAYSELRKQVNDLDEITEVYNNLESNYNDALAMQIPYQNLMSAITELSQLENEFAKVAVAEAKEIYDSETSDAEDFKSAYETLWSSVLGYYKKYESEDLSYEIINPTIEAEGVYDIPEGWLMDLGKGNQYTNYGEHWTVAEDASEENLANRYIDSWNPTSGALIFTATQEIVGLEPGFYILTAAARTSGSGSYIFANNSQTEIPNFGASGNILGKGWSWVDVPCVVGNDNILSIGVKTVEGWTGTWFSADDFSLKYYPATELINSISSVDTDAVKVYVKNNQVVVEGGVATALVNLSGVTLPVYGKLTAGIYYVIVNGKAYPVSVK